MPPPYSSQLFAPTHPANQPFPTPRCCLDAHQPADYILCATCYKHKPQYVVEDDWDEGSPVRVKQQLPINHKISDDFEGPLWQQFTHTCPVMTQEEAADILEYINDSAHIVYAFNSKQILIIYQHQSAVITSCVSHELEAILQTLRARKIGSLRIIQARLLGNRLLKEIPADLARRWRNRPDRGAGQLTHDSILSADRH